jgi:hypothetical protein
MESFGGCRHPDSLASNGGYWADDAVVAGGSVVVNEAHLVSGDPAVFEGYVFDRDCVNSGTARAGAVLGVGVGLDGFGVMDEAVAPEKFPGEIEVGLE